MTGRSEADGSDPPEPSMAATLVSRSKPPYRTDDTGWGPESLTESKAV